MKNSNQKSGSGHNSETATGVQSQTRSLLLNSRSGNLANRKQIDLAKAVLNIRSPKELLAQITPS